MKQGKKKLYGITTIALCPSMKHCESERMKIMCISWLQAIMKNILYLDLMLCFSQYFSRKNYHIRVLYSDKICIVIRHIFWEKKHFAGTKCHETQLRRTHRPNPKILKVSTFVVCLNAEYNMHHNGTKFYQICWS